MKYHTLFVIFEKAQILKMSSAARFQHHFIGPDKQNFKQKFEFIFLHMFWCSKSLFVKAK